jgi:toxin-antitoxin system PIN domain toxin
MMLAPDINVLVAASRSDHPHHRTALAWLDKALASCDSGGGVELLPMVAAGFLRLVTNPKVFSRPTPTKDALGFLDAILKVPGVVMPELGREWPTLRQLCRDKDLRANDIPDAWIAAAIKVLGSRLVTFDKGFIKLLSKSDLSILVSG